MGVALAPQKLRTARTNAGFGLSRAAELVGITHSHLSNVESGRRNLSAPVARKLAELLGTTIAALRP